MMKDLFSLEGRTALVTGGSRGIGKMIAQGFVEMGAKVYISSRKADACAATVGELSEFGTCIALPQDISTVAGCRALADQLRGYESSLDILVNNAGAAWGAPFEEFPEAGWDKTMDLNLKSLFFMTQAVYPELKAASSKDRPGKVINIASIDGIKINPWETYAYQASKAAVIHLTRRMASRLIRDNICVSGIAPGAFASEMNRAARDMGDAVAKMIPAQRIGHASDMAGTAVFLASKAGDYVVGDTLAVDGGVAYSMIGEAWG
jgi:NAD(P)-dependent dehydrogenase (short-subunit alcohol dehydrogenase family)